MHSETAPASKTMFWAGTIISTLAALMFIASGIMKLMKPEPLVKEFARFGYDESAPLAIGITELVCAIIYVIPRTSVLGAILLTGYLGGAIATHVRIGDPFIPPIVLGVAVWLGIFLRDARLRAILPWRS